MKIFETILDILGSPQYSDRGRCVAIAKLCNEALRGEPDDKEKLQTPVTTIRRPPGRPKKEVEPNTN